MWYKTGTVDLTNNSAIVTGTGTFWVTQIKVGDVFTVNASDLYEVISIDSNTQITLGRPYTGATDTGVSYSVIRNFTYTTNATIAANLLALVNSWQVREDEMQAWMTGTANGGVGSDGLYPLTDPTGTTYQVACPAHIEFLAGNSMDWATVAEDIEVDAINYPGKYSALHHAAKAGIAKIAAQAAQTAAETAEVNASTSATNAATSEGNAATSAANASTSEGNANTSATNAASSASAASTSETNAASSAINAATSEGNAATSASNASTSESNASTSETNAVAAEAKADKWAEELEDVEVEAGKYSSKHHAAKSEASATASSGSASASASSASDAATSESNAATSVTNASNFATAAQTAQTAAETAQSAAETAQTNAETAQTTAETAATDAATHLANFQDIYHGALASAPVTNVSIGDLYFDTAEGKMLVCEAVGPDSWTATASSVSGIYRSQRFVAIEGQTTFAIPYDVGYVHVYLNGIRLDTTDFTATSGTSVILIFGATAGDIVDIVAFGTFVLADHYTKDESDANFGHLSGYKNKLINGNFDVWQRGNSFVGLTGESSYTADRWLGSGGGDGVSTISRQVFTLGQTDVPNNPTYYYQNQRTTASTIANFIIQQRIEGVSSVAGKEVTVSFYAKVSVAKTFYLAVKQNFGTGGTPSSDVYHPFGSVSLTTSWQKFTLTAVIPSVSGKTLGTDGNDYLELYFSEEGEFSTFTFDVAQVQLEEGSVTTAFEQRHPQQELALCRRYYTDTYETNYSSQLGACCGSLGTNATNTVGFMSTDFPIKMRGIPTVILRSYGGTAGAWANQRAGSDQPVETSTVSRQRIRIKANTGISGDVYSGHYEADAEL